MSKQYPYTGWILMPSMKPKSVIFVSGGRSYYGPYDTTEDGKSYGIGHIYSTKSDAITAGNAQLDEQREKLRRMQERIDKRQATLDKAATTP